MEKKKKRRGKGIVERFWSRVEKTDGCWIWNGSFNFGGYGRIFAEKHKAILAHRFSYQLHIGDIPDGLYVMHSCDNRKCVNPSHLSIGTGNENSKDMVAKGRSLSGDRHPMKKLTSDAVKEIHRLKCTMSNSQIARRFNISHSQAWKIVTGKHWSAALSNLNAEES